MTEEKLDEPYRPAFVELATDLVPMKTGRCPWCHGPVGIDPLLQQQVCPGCEARIATQAALDAVPAGPPSATRSESPDPVTVVALFGVTGYGAIAFALICQHALGAALVAMFVIVALLITLRKHL